jgi:hypothetical protein
MDAATQLALMAKANKVFGNEQTFLSFPVTPLPFPKQMLSFLTDQNLQNLQTFSSLVNRIPHDEAWQPTETRYLWDIYDEVLKEADFASSTRTAEEEAAYQQALQYLRTTGDDGIPADSGFVKAYKQYKDASLLAEQRYLTAKGTAECSTDPVEKQRWYDVDEPALRAEFTACQMLWITQGYKNEVEAAQNTVVHLGARSPLLTWNEWKGLFIRDLDTLTNSTDLSSVFASSFSPSNALDEGAWVPFQLTGAEVKMLVEEAPAELRDRLGVSSGDSAVASLAFEFSSAAIVRSWFNADVFRSRFWRFSDESKVISDGGDPPAGLCTAYVTAVVFARNLTVTTQPTPTGGQGTTPVAGFRFPIAGRVVEVLRRPGVNVGKPYLRRQNPLRVDPVVIRSTQTDALLSPGSSTMKLTLGRIRPFPVIDLGHGNTTSPARRVAYNPFRDLQNVVFTRLPRQVNKDESSTTTGQPSPPPPASPDDTIYILAFICKVVPRCPDPDLTLQW